jgi:SH3 domain protein
MKFLLARIAATALLLTAAAAGAETLYVTNQIKVGLHEEKSTGSPIVKVIPTGTALEVIKKEEDVSYVREPGGASGWINNSYLVDRAPGSPADQEAMARVATLEKQLNEARQQIRDMEAKAPTQPRANDKTLKELRDENASLSQQLKQEKLKSGELQVQMAELRKQVGVTKSNESLYQKITELSEQKKQLEIRLAKARDSAAAANTTAPAPPEENRRRLIAYVLLALILGLVVGVYIMDTVNRRRHGGFRI